jgi:hypothetical protein
VPQSRNVFKSPQGRSGTHPVGKDESSRSVGNDATAPRNDGLECIDVGAEFVGALLAAPGVGWLEWHRHCCLCVFGSGCEKDAQTRMSVPLKDRGELLLEEVLEGLAGAAGTRGGAGMFLLGAVGRRVSDGSGIFFNRHAQLEKGAVVFGGLFQDRLGNRLRAFKLRAGIEIHAHFAAVDFVAALGAQAFGVKAVRQNIAAAAATRVQNSADHARSAGADLFLARGTGVLLFLGPLLAIAFFGLAGILVAVLPVFSIQTNLSGIH